MTLSAVAIGNQFPGLIDIVEGLFWLSCTRQDGGDAYIEFIPVLCGSGNSQIDLLRRQNQVGVISIQIRDRIVFVPTLIFPLLDSPGSNWCKIFIRINGTGIPVNRAACALPPTA